MSASDLGSFSLVILGWLAFRAIYRRAQSRDMHHVPPGWLKADQQERLKRE